jgi:hypothetical protein
MRDQTTPTTRQAARTITAVLIGSMLTASPAWAINDYDLIHRTIPASACAPLDTGMAAKARLQNGAWRFDGANTGAVALYCPLPVNAFPADLAQGFGTHLQFFRVWYRDSDGGAVAARVTASLHYRSLAGTWNAVPGTFNSSTFADILFATKIVLIPGGGHDFVMDGLYSFYVTLVRTNVDEIVEFHGIDFRDGTSAPQ